MRQLNRSNQISSTTLGQLRYRSLVNAAAVSSAQLSCSTSTQLSKQVARLLSFSLPYLGAVRRLSCNVSALLHTVRSIVVGQPCLLSVGPAAVYSAQQQFVSTAATCQLGCNLSGQLEVSSSAQLQTVSVAAIISIKYALSVQLHTFSPAAIFSPVC